MLTLLTNPFFLVFACVTVTSLAATIGHYWHKARRDRLDATLKQAMVQKGMSADEIVRVLNVSRQPSGQKSAGEVDHLAAHA